MTPFSEAKDDSLSKSIELSICAENIRLIYGATLSAVAAIVIAVSFLIYLFRLSLPPYILYGWAGYMLMVVIVRSIVYWAFNRVEEKQIYAFWGKMAIFMAGLTGLGWGLSSFHTGF